MYSDRSPGLSTANPPRSWMRDWRRISLVVVLALLVAAHLVQVFSPLRLDLDAIGYLSRTVSLVDGERFGPTWLPPGYSYALAAFEWMGIGNAWAFAGFNLAFFLLGLAASYAVLRLELDLSWSVALLVVCLTLLSFVFTKYLPIPVADAVYFGLSMSAVALLSRAYHGSPRALLLIAGAVVLASAAMAMRTIGIALLAAVATTLWSVFVSRDASRSALARRRIRAIAVACAALAFLVAIVAVANGDYVSQTIRLYSDVGISERFSRIGNARLRSLGELFLNAPRSVAPSWIRPIYVPVGLLAAGVVGLGFFLSRNRLGPAGSYFLAFVAILLLYPGRQTRYWLPIIPLVLGWGAVLAGQLMQRRGWRPVFLLYLAGYTLAGIGALYYSTSITVSGAGISRTFGDGTWSSAYEAAFDPSRRADEPFESSMHRRAFLLLRRYEPRLDRLGPRDGVPVGVEADDSSRVFDEELAR